MSDTHAELSKIYLVGDRLCLGVAWAGALLCIGLASWYDTWLAAFLVGVPAAAVPTLVHKVMPASLMSRAAVAAGFMVLSATVIHQAHGMIEFHFIIFCLLAVLIVYRDWKAIVVAAGVIAVHHLLFNFLQANGSSIYVFATAGSIGLVLLHAAFVVFESAILIFVAVRAHAEAIEAAETRRFGNYMVMTDGRINLDIEQFDASSEFGTQFAEYLQNLQQIVADLQGRSGSIHDSATEIAAGNTDLSERTEQQASALEQTSSSMQEMLSSVRRNADSAREANQLVNSTRSQAEQGGAVVQQAVEAMTEITSSSKRISNITSVIDEIAFQTNLLALNAAVEAARAGEQGRGFAVVATEVRNLAGRSAEAAKEIKSLIDDSVVKVENGSALVDRSGQTLSEIVNAVKQVSAIVSEIAQSSAEQAEGIGQVSQAVGSMDEMTQRNAALVEQAAASAKDLESHAGALSEMMERFQLPEGLAASHTPRASAPRPAVASIARPAAKPVATPKVSARPLPANSSSGDQDWEEF